MKTSIKSIISNIIKLSFKSGLNGKCNEVICNNLTIVATPNLVTVQGKNLPKLHFGPSATIKSIEETLEGNNY